MIEKSSGYYDGYNSKILTSNSNLTIDMDETFEFYYVDVLENITFDVLPSEKIVYLIANLTSNFNLLFNNVCWNNKTSITSFSGGYYVFEIRNQNGNTYIKVLINDARL